MPVPCGPTEQVAWCMIAEDIRGAAEMKGSSAGTSKEQNANRHAYRTLYIFPESAMNVDGHIVDKHKPFNERKDQRRSVHVSVA